MCSDHAQVHSCSAAVAGGRLKNHKRGGSDQQPSCRILSFLFHSSRLFWLPAHIAPILQQTSHANRKYLPLLKLLRTCFCGLQLNETPNFTSFFAVKRWLSVVAAENKKEQRPVALFRYLLTFHMCKIQTHTRNNQHFSTFSL